MFSYSENTGFFTRLALNNFRPVGCFDKDGYLIITIKAKKYFAHRLAWMYVYGDFPSSFIDHRNGIKNDNKIKNLRSATASQNQYNTVKKSNNTSNAKGVFWQKDKKRWRARCFINGSNKHLGYFQNINDASAAYQAFAKANHGEFFKETK